MNVPKMPPWLASKAGFNFSELIETRRERSRPRLAEDASLSGLIPPLSSQFPRRTAGAENLLFMEHR